MKPKEIKEKTEKFVPSPPPPAVIPRAIKKSAIPLTLEKSIVQEKII